MTASRSDAERDVKACGQRDDATPFTGWGQRRPARAKKLKPEPLPFDPADMQAVAVALYGECRICKALLEVDGSCPDESSHEKHVCPDCGAESVEPLSVARPCLFENEHGRRHAAE